MQNLKIILEKWGVNGTPSEDIQFREEILESIGLSISDVMEYRWEEFEQLPPFIKNKINNLKN